MQNSCEGFEGIDDGQLVSLTQQGSEGAFAELMRRHSRGMMQMALRILRDTEDAEDELQNAWCKAWQHIDGFAGDSRFTHVDDANRDESVPDAPAADPPRTFPVPGCAGGGRGARCFELRDDGCDAGAGRWTGAKSGNWSAGRSGGFRRCCGMPWCCAKWINCRCRRWRNSWGFRYPPRSRVCCARGRNCGGDWKSTAGTMGAASVDRLSFGIMGFTCGAIV